MRTFLLLLSFVCCCLSQPFLVNWTGTCSSSQGFGFSWSVTNNGKAFRPIGKNVNGGVPCDEYFEVGFSFLDFQGNVISFPNLVASLYSVVQASNANGIVVATVPPYITSFGSGYFTTNGATLVSNGQAFTFTCNTANTPNLRIRTDYFLTATNNPGTNPNYVRTLNTVTDIGSWGSGLQISGPSNPPTSLGLGKSMCVNGTSVTFGFPAEPNPTIVTAPGQTNVATSATPTSATQGNPTSATQATPTSATQATSNSATQGNPTSATQAIATSATRATQGNPTSATQAIATSATQGNPTSANPTSANPTSANPTSANPTSATRMILTSATQATPTSATQGNPTSANPTSTTQGNPTSATQATPTSETQATPTYETQGNPVSDPQENSASSNQGNLTSDTAPGTQGNLQGNPTSAPQENPTSVAQENPTLTYGTICDTRICHLICNTTVVVGCVCVNGQLLVQCGINNGAESWTIATGIAWVMYLVFLLG